MPGDDGNTQGGTPAPESATEKKTQTTPPPQAAKPTESTPADEPKLTPAQLKAKAKAEKAARRAAAKEVKTVTVQPEPQTQQTPAKGKGLPQQESTGQQQAPTAGKSALPHRPSISARRPSVAAIEKDVRSAIPDCFSHIPMARRVPMTHASKDVHPSVLAAGQQMATFKIRGSAARLEATLLAFRKVIEAYETPHGLSLSRHFVPNVLNHQIEYLTECRPMCIAMGNAIRIIKAKVNNFDIDTPEHEAKEVLLDLIDDFLAERVTVAELLISKNVAKMISSGDVVLTYGGHKLVQMGLLEAHRSGKQFEVLIYDDPHDPSGQRLAKALSAEGIQTSYSPNLTGLSLGVKQASFVLVGAEAFFANGAMYALSGTDQVAVCGRDAQKRVIALCETINFDRERIALNSLSYNEIDPDRNSKDSFRLLFDVTKEKNITGIITENHGETATAPSEAILSILSRQDQLMARK